MKANRRRLKSILGKVKRAAESCTFDHNSQPSIELCTKNSTPNDEVHDADEVSEFMDISNIDSKSKSRSLVGDLAAYAIRWKLGRQACNDLFRVLTNHGIEGLPKDCRSAKHTLRKVDVDSMPPNGNYYHFGLANELTRNMSFFTEPNSVVRLQFNVDGLPLYKSSPLDFWPILCRAFVGEIVTKVFPVGLFCGKSKPSSVDEYLGQFIRECNSVIENGLDINGVHFSVEIHSFVCDAPARQYVKRIISHAGYYSCERCVIKGETGIKFVETNCSLRSDAMFRAHAYTSHQNSQHLSPLVDLPINLITHFPMEYMHLGLLGVVKRLLRCWLGTTDYKVTKFSSNFRLSLKNTALRIESRIKFCSEKICSEFDRRPRQFDENKWFKAKEYRTLLCYTVPYIFRDLFNNAKVYNHFLLLVVSFRVMLCKKPTPNLVSYVRELLIRFVREVQELYGTFHMTYSVHNLIHVPDDYEKFGVLDNISAFPFESFMLKLKKYVGRPGQELQQVVNRKYEETMLDECPYSPAVDELHLSKTHAAGPLGAFNSCPIDAQYGQAVYAGRKFSNSERDNCICMNDRFGQIVNFIVIESKLYTLVRFFGNKTSFFTYPCPSENVGIVKCSNLKEEVVAVDLKRVEKCMCFPLENDFYVAKLLHETLNAE